MKAVYIEKKEIEVKMYNIVTTYSEQLDDGCVTFFDSFSGKDCQTKDKWELKKFLIEVEISVNQKKKKIPKNRTKKMPEKFSTQVVA